MPIRQEASHRRRGLKGVVIIVAVCCNVTLHRTAKLFVISTGESFGDTSEEEALESSDKIVCNSLGPGLLGGIPEEVEELSCPAFVFIGERKPAACAGELAASDASGNESSECSQVALLGIFSFYPVPVFIVAICPFRCGVSLTKMNVTLTLSRSADGRMVRMISRSLESF